MRLTLQKFATIRKLGAFMRKAGCATSTTGGSEPGTATSEYEATNSAFTEGTRCEVVACVLTDAGCVRETNEDHGIYVKPNDPALLAAKGVLAVVADGMGGHAAGEVASRLAVEVISRTYYEEGAGSPDLLKKAFERANNRIYEKSSKDETLRGMGTTCTALVLREGTAFIAHVGDSRVYIVRAGEIYLLTEDHSAVMEMVKQGVITTEQARSHDDKNVILRALGTNPEVEVTTWEKPLRTKEGDRYLLCSDGLYDLVENEEIKQAVMAAPDPYSACEWLIALAKERGGYDNITVGLLSIESEDGVGSRAVRVTREVKTSK